jgi:hypothetical protein
MLLHHRHLGYLHPGEYFGEYSCLLGQERSATVVASSYVELYSLNRADLELVLQQWPELAEQFESMGEWTSCQPLSVQAAWCTAFPTCLYRLWYISRWKLSGWGDACCAQAWTGRVC